LKKRLTKSLYTQEWEALLKILKDLRKKRGWTQARMARKLGRPQSVVAKIEAGERKLDVCQFIEYVRILECDPVEAIWQLTQAIKRPESRR
jgi:transcriptional regulator with XRE-family HTH domain